MKMLKTCKSISNVLELVHIYEIIKLHEGNTGNLKCSLS